MIYSCFTTLSYSVVSAIVSTVKYTWPKLMQSSVCRLLALSVIYISCCLRWMSFAQVPCSVLLSTGNGNNSPVLAITGVYPGVVHKLGGFGRNSGGAGIGRCCITYHADLGQARLLGGTIKKSQLFAGCESESRSESVR